MVLLNEMTPVWSLYLSFGVIVIFSNAAVLGSQLKQRTTEEATTNPFHYMVTQKQNESSTRPISATPGIHPSGSENTTSSSVRYETTTPEHVRLESTAGYSSSAFTPEQSPKPTQRVTRPSERTNEKYATSSLTPVHSSMEPTSISIHTETHTQNREESEMTTFKTVRPDSTTFPATISYTEDSANVTTPPTSSIQPEMEKDKTGKIKTKMKKVILATKLAKNRQTLVKDTMVVTIPPTVNWTPTESYTSERNLPFSLSTKNMTEPESNFPPISLKKLTTEGGTTTPSLDVTEYDQTIRDTSTSMSTTFQTTNALKFNVTYYEAVKPTKFSPRFPNTSIPLSTVTPLAMTVAALHQSSFSNTNFANVAANDEQRSLNKERSQFPGITLKVSHVLIPKQKRNAFSSLPDAFHRAEMLRKARIAAKSSNRKSNCTRSPVQVVTAADSESNEKVNLTEEHYDCEFLSELRSTQKENEEDSIHTFYGGYVFRYTIPKQTNDSAPNRTTSTESTRATTVMSTTIEENDDYDSSYVEYSDPANTNTTNSTDVVDDGVFPNPELNARKVPLEVKLELSSSPTSESSMLDNDLHDHDVIDSVMYIYFGGATHGQKGAGRQIIIVGAVIALVAQFLTLASSLRRIKTHKGEEATVILLNIETALTLTNLIFLLGVQSTSNHTLCKLTAVLLFYFHLVIIIWFGLSSIYSVQVVCQKKPTSCTFLKYCFGAWLLPLLLTSLNYAFNERSFETSSYCWISPLRGVLISFILPVFVLSLMCVVLTLYGLKHGVEPLDEVDDTYSHRKLLRLTAVSLPIFSVTWFTGMVTLENSASLLYSLIFLISDTVLNWLLFACWLPSEASQWKDMDEDYYDEEEDFDDEPVIIKRRFDDQPLLSELYEYGAQGQLYNLKVEPISIIHTP